LHRGQIGPEFCALQKAFNRHHLTLPEPESSGFLSPRHNDNRCSGEPVARPDSVTGRTLHAAIIAMAQNKNPPSPTPHPVCDHRLPGTEKDFARQTPPISETCRETFDRAGRGTSANYADCTHFSPICVFREICG
jgi:hypothetical protein